MASRTVKGESLYYLDQIVAAQANAAAYRDGFLIVAVIFFATIIPALYIRTPKPGAAGKVNGLNRVSPTADGL